MTLISSTFFFPLRRAVPLLALFSLACTFSALHGLRASEDGSEHLLLDDLKTQRVLSEVAFD